MCVQVDAIKLIGTLDNPPGVVTDLWQRVVYVPDPFVYGIDHFSYALSDCPYKDQDQSDISTLAVHIDNINDAPTLATTAFNVSSARVAVWPIEVSSFDRARPFVWHCADANTTEFSVTFWDIDQHTAVTVEPLPEQFALTITSLPALGTTVP